MKYIISKLKTNLHKPVRADYKTSGTFKIMFGITMLLLICFLSNTRVVEAATLKIRYGGKTYSYTASQASATIDGSSIELNGTPGVILNDTCMLSAKDVFASGLGATYSYDSTTKAITISQNDITVKMTLNTKTAYINGTKSTCDVAPTQIKFIDANKTKIYLPARFVAEALGYTYTWNTSSKTSEMIQPFVIKYNGTWTVYKGTQGKVTFDGSSVKLTGMPSIIVDNTSLLRAATVFKTAMGCDYTYDKTTKTVTIAKDGISVVMNINSKSATVNGTSYTMDTEARIVYNKSTGKSFVMVPGAFVAKKLGFNYSWNSSTKTSEITTGTKTYFSQIFSAIDDETSITSVEATSSDKADILTITGNSSLDVTVTEIDETNIILTISNASTDISGFTQAVESSYYLNNVTMTVEEDTIDISVEKEADCNYYTSQSGNTYKLVMCENADASIDNSSYQLKFDAPDNFQFDKITTDDQYYKNRFIITLYGDYVSYFQSNPISYNSSIVKKVTVKLSGTTKTKIIVDTYNLQGFKVNNCGDYIGVDIADPKQIYDKIVVLDAGHGGKDNGTSNNGTLEKDLNLTIIYELAKEYFNSKDSDIKAYWTRYDDTFVTLDDRAAYASTIGADAFISLHMNAATTSSAKGLEVYYYSGNTSKMGSMNSKTMATIFYNQLIGDLDMTKRSVKSAGFVVVKKNTVPSILIELGFLSNSSDYKKLTDPDFQDQAAKSIYDAAVAMFNTYDTGR